MTFDDDFMQLPTPQGIRRFRCAEVDITWPPPEIISYEDRLYYRERYSSISDADRQVMTAVMRGAEYRRLDNVVQHHSVVPKIN